MKKAVKSEVTAKRVIATADGNHAMHVTGIEEIEEYARRFPTHHTDNPVDDVWSYTKQNRIREEFRAGMWEIHHLAERRISRALGIPDHLHDASPSINLPTRINGGHKIMDPESLVRYRDKFGRDPVTHRGPDGIKESIDQIFRRNNFPEQTVLQPAQQQALINELHALYAQDARYLHLKLWPITRDWLRKHMPGSYVNVPIDNFRECF